MMDEATLLDTVDDALHDLKIEREAWHAYGKTVIVILRSKVDAQALGRALRRKDFQEITIKQRSGRFILTADSPP